MPTPPAASPILGVPARGMGRIPTLGPLMAPGTLVLGEQSCRHQPISAFLAWGLKPSSMPVARLAARRGLPLWRCEDGFLRSMGLGPEEPPWSLVVDDLGIYYDAERPSRLEAWIATTLDARQQRRAQDLRQLWCLERVSKYNAARDSAVPEEPFVLVVDQTAGDLSIRHGLADATSFSRMLAAALADHPAATVLVKTHPDVVAGRKRGHFTPTELDHPRVRLWADGGHPASLLEHTSAVYVVTSQLGFEGLLWGKPVHCFGMPFYGGWGLTRDDLPSPNRRQGIAPSLEQLVHACLIAYPRYIDPQSRQRCDVERVVALIGLQRRRRQELPAQVEAFGFKPWKQPILKRFLAGSQIRFRRRAAQPDGRHQALAIWGRDPAEGVGTWLQAHPKAELLRLEDGFLRSVGLGANLITPISWVIDRGGIYYDAGNPSDLETYLASHDFSPDERQRAAALRQALVAARLTKYNLQATGWKRPADQRRVVLVPGQVEGDASIRYGAPGWRRNRELLAAVRGAEPDAWIVYKPHPDVVAGLRRGSAAPEATAGLWDEQVETGAIEEFYDQVDAVHVLTSLAGFEALLRGVEVHTWGLPFYAGWGLTSDQISCPRRGRPLTIDELVFGALIQYPRYVSRRSGLFIQPEEAIAELGQWRSAPPSGLGWWRRLFRQWGRWRERINPDRAIQDGD